MDSLAFSQITYETANSLGISYNLVVFLFLAIVIWSSVWKLIAMWKAAKRNSLGWFIALGLINTIGILEILYVYVFSEINLEKTGKKKKKKK